MADTKTGIRKPRILPPAQPQVALCVDFIDLGESVEQFGSQEPKIVEKIAYVFLSTKINPDTGKPFEIALELTDSMGKKARVRKYLGDWRGAPITDEEAMAGVAYHERVGQGCILNIQHKTSQASGNTRAEVATITPLLEGMTAPTALALDYERAPFWKDKKAEYAEAVAAFRAKAGVGGGESAFDSSGSLKDEDDDLPF